METMPVGQGTGTAPPPANNNRKWIIIGVAGALAACLCVCLAVVAFVAFTLFVNTPAPAPAPVIPPGPDQRIEPSTPLTPTEKPATLNTSGHTWGNPNAPVTIDEWSDLQ